MSFDFKGETPIYLQLIECIRLQIVCGEILPNQKLPSVRELSLQYQVNPNTIQKALGELEKDGLIFTDRTNGKYVTDNEKLIRDVKCEITQNVIDEFHRSMEKLKITDDEALQMLKERRDNK